MISPTLFDPNPVKYNYYQFMITQDKYSRSCNSANDLSTKICVLRKKMNIKVFSLITNKNEAKKMVKDISCDCKCTFNSTTCNSNEKWNNGNSKHLKHVVHD